jgi:hypothetical protein
MKKLLLVVLSLLLVVVAAGTVLADKANKGKFEGKAGDTIYVCACGEACKCGTIGLKEGTCGCGKELVKTKVSKVEKGKVFYKIDGKEQSSLQQGKFMCGCGEGCNCGFLSQKAGKCGCGKEMVKVKKS